MKYSAIIPNDVVNGEGICTSFFVQGCPHHCPGCFNEETWDFNGGQEYTDHTKWLIIELLSANGVQRNFSVLGGEPMCPENLDMTEEVVSTVRSAYPDIKIFLWTGYTYSELMQASGKDLVKIISIFNQIDVLIDGPFIESEKDLNLKLRGSKNQKVRIKKDNKWEIREDG